MASKIKGFNFNKCQHLRKLVIDDKVEYQGNIDLSDTPINKKFNIYETHIEFERPEKFKNLPDGIVLKPEDYKKIIWKTGTSEAVNQATQTETEEEINNLSKIRLTRWDEKLLEMSQNCLFWFNELKESGKIDYLIQRKNELKHLVNTNKNDLNGTLRLLAEHVLNINEKIIENAEYFDEMGNIVDNSHPETPPQSSTPPRQWKDFHKYLSREVLKMDDIGEIWKFKDEAIKYHGNTSIYKEDEYKFNAKLDISERALNRFMNSLEATMDNNGSKYWTFAPFDEDWGFEEYYNSDARRIGFKTETKGISESGLKALLRMFKYWKKVYTPPPPLTSTNYLNINEEDKKRLRQIINGFINRAGKIVTSDGDFLNKIGLTN